MILFLEFFILQRLMNITLEIAMQVHEAGIEFMEAATRVYPEHNRAHNPEKSPNAFKGKFFLCLHIESTLIHLSPT